MGLFILSSIASAFYLKKVSICDLAQFTRNGETYRCKGVSDGYPMFSYMYFYAVVSDDAAAAMKESVRCIAYDLKDGEYDAAAPKKN